jgi:hypothetical protein
VRLDLPHQCVDPGYHSAFPDVLGHCEGESGETKWTKDQKNAISATWSAAKGSHP